MLGTNSNVFNINIMLSADILARLVTITGRKVAAHLSSRPQNFIYFLLILITACDKQVS